MIPREQLKQIIADQREYTPPDHFYNRIKTKEIQKWVTDPNILIFTGIRRCGKSTLLRLFQKELLPSDYYLNFDDERLISFQVEDFQALLEVFLELFGKQTTFYFDEIQNIPGWERFIRRLYEQGNKVFLTGSNANLLSKELGTHLTGRYIPFEIYPLSFKEILQQEYPKAFTSKALSTTDKGLILKTFSNYLTFGGIPEYVKFQKQEYLQNLYEGILYRDVITRYQIKEEKALKELTHYFASQIGKEFSHSKLAKLVGLNTPHTLSNYCSYLENCYLLFTIYRYHPSLKKQIQSNKKCYLIDPALISLIGFRFSEDRGRLLENLVFLELKRRSFEIYFHKEKKECDFLIRQKNQITQAIQVCSDLSNPTTKKREIEGLLEAMRTYHLSEGICLTEYDEEIIQVDTFQIQILPIWKWLLQDG